MTILSTNSCRLLFEVLCIRLLYGDELCMSFYHTCSDTCYTADGTMSWMSSPQMQFLLRHVYTQVTLPMKPCKQCERWEAVQANPTEPSPQPLTRASRFLIPFVKFAGCCIKRLAVGGAQNHAFAAGGCGWPAFWSSRCLGQGSSENLRHFQTQRASEPWSTYSTSTTTSFAPASSLLRPRQKTTFQ
jgi:hypothetical protein